MAVVLCASAACEDGRAVADAGPPVLDVVDVQVVGTLDAIAKIEDLVPSSDGATWVINSVDPFVILLSAEGEELRSAGRLGEGPGEFSWPTTFVRNPTSGDLWVYDAALGRLTLVGDHELGGETLSLAEASSGPFRINSYEYLWMSNGGRTWLHGTEEGFVYARPSAELPWIGAFWSTAVTRLSPGQPPEQLVSTADAVGDPRPRFGDAMRFLPYPIWAGCPDGSLALYDPNANALRRFSGEGEASTVHSLPPERSVRVSTERLFSTVYPGILKNRLMANAPERDALFDLLRRDYEAREAEFSEVFPEYVHLDCGPQGMLWLQEFDTGSGQMGRGPDWLRISSGGEVRRVKMPPTFRPMRFADDRIWGVHTDELDVEHVAWARLSGL